MRSSRTTGDREPPPLSVQLSRLCFDRGVIGSVVPLVALLGLASCCAPPSFVEMWFGGAEQQQEQHATAAELRAGSRLTEARLTHTFRHILIYAGAGSARRAAGRFTVYYNTALCAFRDVTLKTRP